MEKNHEKTLSGQRREPQSFVSTSRLRVWVVPAFTAFPLEFPLVLAHCPSPPEKGFLATFAVNAPAVSPGSHPAPRVVAGPAPPSFARGGPGRGVLEPWKVRLNGKEVARLSPLREPPAPLPAARPPPRGNPRRSQAGGPGPKDARGIPAPPGRSPGLPEPLPPPPCRRTRRGRVEQELGRFYFFRYRPWTLLGPGSYWELIGLMGADRSMFLRCSRRRHPASTRGQSHLVRAARPSPQPQPQPQPHPHRLPRTTPPGPCGPGGLYPPAFTTSPSTPCPGPCPGPVRSRWGEGLLSPSSRLAGPGTLGEAPVQSAQNFAADGAVPWGLGPLAPGWAGAPREALPPRWLRGGMQSCLALPFGAGEVRYSRERGEQVQTGSPASRSPERPLWLQHATV